jgi:hypothetical protein
MQARVTTLERLPQRGCTMPHVTSRSRSYLSSGRWTGYKGFIALGEYVYDCCTRLWPLPSSIHLCFTFYLQIAIF